MRNIGQRSRGQIAEAAKRLKILVSAQTEFKPDLKQFSQGNVKKGFIYAIKNT